MRLKLLGILLIASLGAGPTTRALNPAQLELAATTAFNAGQYATALPMLQKLRTDLASQPEKLGPVEERIRVCEAQVAKSANAGAAAPAAAQTPTDPSNLTAEARHIHAPPVAGEVRELEIKDLGNFNYDVEKGGNIPADVKALAGSKLRMRGFMLPLDQAENITQFAPVPSLFACCFGQPPQVQHTIMCSTPKGKSVAYYPDEISVEGTLKVEEKKDEGFIVSIFELDVSSVKPAAK